MLGLQLISPPWRWRARPLWCSMPGHPHDLLVSKRVPGGFLHGYGATQRRRALTRRLHDADEQQYVGGHRPLGHHGRRRRDQAGVVVRDRSPLSRREQRASSLYFLRAMPEANHLSLSTKRREGP